MTRGWSAVKVALLRRLPRGQTGFDYALPSGLEVKAGDLVDVPFKSSSLVGIVLGQADNPEGRPLKQLLGLKGRHYLTATQLALAEWLAEYYAVSQSLVLMSCVGPLPVKTRLDFTPPAVKLVKKNTPSTLVVRYASAVGHERAVISLVSKVVKRQQQAMVLVSEQAALENWRKLLMRLGRVVTYSSEFSVTAQAATWRAVRQKQTDIILGTRSAIFLPVARLGGIIVDAAESDNYKQSEQNPRYDLSDVAGKLAYLSGASLAFVSAAPRLEQWWLTQQKQATWLDLGTSTSNRIELIDLKLAPKADRILSPELINAITRALVNKQKVFLYLNRRGSATLALCQDCGYRATCPVCGRNLVWAEPSNDLRCYHCGTSAPSPIPCPKCRSLKVKFTGLGVGALSKAVAKHWPQARLISLEGKVDQLASSKLVSANIIIGSRAALPHVSYGDLGLLALVSPDLHLNMPEFRSAEGVWALANHLLAATSCPFVIQTYRAEHAVWRSLTQASAQEFYKNELADRRNFGYPPAVSLLRLTTQNKDSARAKQEASEVERKLRPALPLHGLLLGPYPDYFVKTRRNYRFHILLKLPPEYNPARLWSLLPDDVIVDRNPWSVLS